MGGAKALAELRARLTRWEGETNDHGRTPESEAMFDSEMAAYLGGNAAKQDAVLKKNIALMKRWAKEGK